LQILRECQEREVSRQLHDPDALRMSKTDVCIRLRKEIRFSIEEAAIGVFNAESVRFAAVRNLLDMSLIFVLSYDGTKSMTGRNLLFHISSEPAADITELASSRKP